MAFATELGGEQRGQCDVLLFKFTKKSARILRE